MSPLRGLKAEPADRAPNPFVRSIANSALERNLTDVAEINAQAFEKCRNVITDVREGAGTQALLIFGEAGSGKTHLLSRLRETLEKDAQSGKPSLFVPIRMATSATMIWRWLRRHLVDALLREQGGSRALTNVIVAKPEKIAEQDRNLGIVIGNLMAGRHFVDSAAWLRGDDLPEDVERALGIAGPGDDEEQEAASQRLLKMICGLGGSIPFVFCFDQVEALENFQGETAGRFKFGQVISDLHDGTQNLVLLSCMQTSLVQEMEAAIRQADRDRMMRQRAQLLPLGWDQAVKLINSRLETVDELKEKRALNKDKLWPLEESQLRPLFTDGFCVARKVIVGCRELFDQWQQKAAEPAEPVDKAIGRRYEELLGAPSIADAESILRTGLPKVFHVVGMNAGGSLRPNSSLESVSSGQKGFSFAVCNQRAGAALIKRLEKVHKDWGAEGGNQLIILRDQRNGIGVNAQRSRETVEKLEKAGARFVNVKPEALAALDAISRLLADARSGDFWHRGEKVPANSVEQWLKTNMPRAVDELMGSISAEKQPPADDLTGMLTELLANFKVIELEAAAQQLKKSAQEVEECARRNTSLVGFAGGNKRVLFRIVEQRQGIQRG